MSDTILNPTTLSPVQAQVVAALATGSTVTAAAHAAGIHRATIHNWMHGDEAFQTAVAQAREEHAAALADSLEEIRALAFDTIRHILTDPAIPPSVRLKAALAALDRGADLQPAVHSTQLDSGAGLRPAVRPPQFDTLDETPRNAPCPCGSGVKYKRCCGTNAPPQLLRAA